MWACAFRLLCISFSFFNHTPPTEIDTLSLHDALPISETPPAALRRVGAASGTGRSATPARARAGVADRPVPDAAPTRRSAAGGVSEIGRASCRERVSISVGGVWLKKEKEIHNRRNAHAHIEFDKAGDHTV